MCCSFLHGCTYGLSSCAVLLCMGVHMGYVHVLFFSVWVYIWAMLLCCSSQYGGTYGLCYCAVLLSMGVHMGYIIVLFFSVWVYLWAKFMCCSSLYGCTYGLSSCAVLLSMGVPMGYVHVLFFSVWVYIWARFTCCASATQSHAMQDSARKCEGYVPRYLVRFFHYSPSNGRDHSALDRNMQYRSAWVWGSYRGRWESWHGL